MGIVIKAENKQETKGLKMSQNIMHMCFIRYNHIIIMINDNYNHGGIIFKEHLGILTKESVYGSLL